jgi:chemotaxis protein methyltransferase CheR
LVHTNIAANATKDTCLTAAPAQTPYAVEGPPDPDLVRLRDLIYEFAGIFHPDNKLRLLADRCRGRMRDLKAETFRDYIDYLMLKPNRQAEMIALVNNVTIGETRFFRNPPQLEAFCRIVIPTIIRAKRTSPSRTLRIWSSGCSTGEEPYTLSILLQEEACAVLKEWIVEILATDINEHSLAHAKAGLYGQHSTRNLSAKHKQKYFTEVGDQLQVLPIARQNVIFSRLNLSDERRIGSMNNLDVIFCCNVLIYFDLASKRRVIRRFYNSLLPHGYLFLGHSESLYGVSDEFDLVHLPGTTAYVKRRLPVQE